MLLYGITLRCSLYSRPHWPCPGCKKPQSLLRISVEYEFMNSGKRRFRHFKCEMWHSYWQLALSRMRTVHRARKEAKNCVRWTAQAIIVLIHEPQTSARVLGVSQPSARSLLLVGMCSGAERFGILGTTLESLPVWLTLTELGQNTWERHSQGGLRWHLSLEGASPFHKIISLLFPWAV